MSTGERPHVSELLPAETWDALAQEQDAVLIDVRTQAEWSFIGCPDLSDLNRSVLCIEWARYPDMSVNPQFVDDVKQALAGATPPQLFFLCRSGVRSLAAAKAVKAAFDEEGVQADCVNIGGGFEGDLDPQKHRGGLNGWKAQGLPWRQS